MNKHTVNTLAREAIDIYAHLTPSKAVVLLDAEDDVDFSNESPWHRNMADKLNCLRALHKKFSKGPDIVVGPVGSGVILNCLPHEESSQPPLKFNLLLESIDKPLSLDCHNVRSLILFLVPLVSLTYKCDVLSFPSYNHPRDYVKVSFIGSPRADNTSECGQLRYSNTSRRYSLPNFQVSWHDTRQNFSNLLGDIEDHTAKLQEENSRLLDENIWMRLTLGRPLDKAPVDSLM
ncbi:hypothetical protein F5B20DRAFT_547915 [Whalleya microplaca]|nr:hypothetical protein F5B20DRAFT_547915 [Whalleya microplaca]